MSNLLCNSLAYSISFTTRKFTSCFQGDKIAARVFPKEKSQLHKIPPFLFTLLFSSFFPILLPSPSLPIVPFSFPPLLFPFTFFPFLPFPLTPFLFSFSFPLSFLSQKTKQEVWGALLAPPAGSGAWHRIAANCNCTNVQLELHILCRNCTLGQTLIAAYSISMKSTQGDLRMLPRGHARTHTQTDGQPENLRPLAPSMDKGRKCRNSI